MRAFVDRDVRPTVRDVEHANEYPETWIEQMKRDYLADMTTKLTAARQLTLHAARCYDSGERADMEAGMAKLFASEVAMETALSAVRIHGGYGYSTPSGMRR